MTERFKRMGERFNRVVDRLIYAGDKANPDTYLKGRFFLITQAMFLLMSLLSMPYYLSGDAIDIPPYVAFSYVLVTLVQASGFIVYPRFGLRVAFVNAHSILASFTSMYSTYYFSGGLYSPDLAFAPAITIYVFLVANRISGLFWTCIGIVQMAVYYQEAIKHPDLFRSMTERLDPGYYFYNILFAVFFAVMVVLLYENMMQRLLGIIRSDKATLEVKNKEITESITYARGIQQAKLPKSDDIWAVFPQCFVLFLPKDIVSGDFYFFHKTEGKAFLAAADCTGHGVPGALMSMVSSERLTEAVAQTDDVATVLQRVNVGIKASLRQSQGQADVRDGMDIALCSFDTTSGQLRFAGANRPLWVLRKGSDTVEVVRPTKVGLGGSTPDSQRFEAVDVPLQQGDTFYLLTDGFADQFGGPQQRKLMGNRLREELVSIRHLTMPEQEAHLSRFFHAWKGANEQVDDVLVIGVRL